MERYTRPCKRNLRCPFTSNSRCHKSCGIFQPLPASYSAGEMRENERIWWCFRERRNTIASSRWLVGDCTCDRKKKIYVTSVTGCLFFRNIVSLLRGPSAKDDKCAGSEFTRRLLWRAKMTNDSLVVCGFLNFKIGGRFQFFLNSTLLRHIYNSSRGDFKRCLQSVAKCLLRIQTEDAKEFEEL